MKTNLMLTELQASDAEDVNVEYESKNLVLLANYMRKKQLKQTITRNEQKRDEELRKIFTPEQFSIWTARKKEVEMFNAKQVRAGNKKKIFVTST